MSTNLGKLSTGEWPISEIRPDEWQDFFIRHPAPERPHGEKEVLGGVIEKITLPDDSPLLDDYYREMMQYNQKGRHFEWLAGFATVDVPKDWELSLGKQLAFEIETIGPDDPVGRKLQYIKHHILATAADVTEVKRLTDAIITREERAAGGEKFPGADGDETGDMGSASTDPGKPAQADGSDG